MNSSAITKQFDDLGYIVVEDVLDPETILDPIITEYENVLDDLCGDLYNEQEIKSTYDNLPFDERIIKIYNETGRPHAQYFDFSLPFSDVKPDTPFWCGPAVFNAFVSDKLLDVVENLLEAK